MAYLGAVSPVRAGPIAVVASARGRPVATRLVGAAAVAAILLLAIVVRFHDLAMASGTLGVDEARLALVAQGIAEHGWPVLPTGKVYTRGLVPALLMAPGLAALGPTDLAARLPSAVAGVLLVGVMFFYGRRLGGTGAGLLAAALAATWISLASFSRQAWLYSMLTLFWVLALYLLDRALVSGGWRALVLSGWVTGLAVLTHELTVLLLPAVSFGLLAWMRGGPRAERLRWVMAATIPIVAALGVLAVFTLTLRSDTLAGRMAEVDEYLTPGTELAELPSYLFTEVFRGRELLVLPFAGAALLAAPHRRHVLLPGLAILPLLLAVILFSSIRGERYAVALIPPVLLLAAVGAALMAQRVARRLRGPLGLAAGAGVYVLVLGALPTPADLLRETELPRGRTSWTADLQASGYQPGDLVLTDIPTVTQFYLGRTDFWLRSRHYEKYATTAFDGQVRDIHTGALLVRSGDELERLVVEPNQGRIAWVVASRATAQWFTFLDESTREQLAKYVVRSRSTRGPQLYKLRLER